MQDIRKSVVFLKQIKVDLADLDWPCVGRPANSGQNWRFPRTRKKAGFR
jgi:hypothetical protein